MIVCRSSSCAARADCRVSDQAGRDWLRLFGWAVRYIDSVGFVAYCPRCRRDLDLGDP